MFITLTVIPDASSAHSQLASPLYVRCGYTPQEYAELAEKPFNELNEEQQRKRAQFFHLGDPDAQSFLAAAYEGCCVRWLRLAGYGKMEKVIDRQLFYRSVSDQTTSVYLLRFVGRFNVEPIHGPVAFGRRFGLDFFAYVVEVYH
jgi:hypothetical protein